MRPPEAAHPAIAAKPGGNEAVPMGRPPLRSQGLGLGPGGFVGFELPAAGGALAAPEKPTRTDRVLDHHEAAGTPTEGANRTVS